MAPLRIERRGAISIYTADRPEARNAFTCAMLESLLAGLDADGRDPTIRCAVLTGGNGLFTAGADLKEVAGRGPFDPFVQERLDLWRAIGRTEIVKIAAIEGIAYGGGTELALMCDLVVASESASFALPELNVGLLPGAGGTQRLPRMVGKFRAMEMILTGDPVPAPTMKDWGVVSRIVPLGRARDEAIAWAEQIAARPTAESGR